MSTTMLSGYDGSVACLLCSVNPEFGFLKGRICVHYSLGLGSLVRRC
jgi:hypothetical protein